MQESQVEAAERRSLAATSSADAAVVIGRAPSGPAPADASGLEWALGAEEGLHLVGLGTRELVTVLELLCRQNDEIVDLKREVDDLRRRVLRLELRP